MRPPPKVPGKRYFPAEKLQLILPQSGAANSRERRERMTTDEMRSALLHTTFRYGKVNMGIRLGNITHGEFTTLQMVHMYMKNHPDEHGIGVSELARCSYMSPPAMSRTLKSVEEKGLAERMIDKKNRRKTYVCLTAEGEDARLRAWKMCTDYIDSVLKEMGEEKMETFLKLWEELVDLMEKSIPAFYGETS